jgi:hypothetical protein
LLHRENISPDSTIIHSNPKNKIVSFSPAEADLKKTSSDASSASGASASETGGDDGSNLDNDENTGGNPQDGGENDGGNNGNNTKDDGGSSTVSGIKKRKSKSDNEEDKDLSPLIFSAMNPEKELGYFRSFTSETVFDVHAPHQTILFRQFMEGLVRVAIARFPYLHSLEDQISKLFKEFISPYITKPGTCTSYDFLKTPVYESIFAKRWNFFYDKFLKMACGEGQFGVFGSDKDKGEKAMLAGGEHLPESSGEEEEASGSDVDDEDFEAKMAALSGVIYF